MGEGQGVDGVKTTGTAGRTAVAGAAEEAAVEALRWLLAAARPAGGGLAWTTRPSADEFNPSLYSGTSGIVFALLEAQRHFADDLYGDAALRAARYLADAVGDWELHSLYLGLAGMAAALDAVHTALGDPASAAAARHALDRVRAAHDGTGWGSKSDVIAGAAGIAIGALACGDVELAVLATENFARTAEPTAAGVTWETSSGRAARLHHVSHGTIGIVHALASVGRAAGRPDLTELALAGAADVVSRDEAGPEGFLVPHSDPPAGPPDRVARYTYGWCHGPTGDAQTFRLLGDALGDRAWSALADRCWHTVTHSGLPQRLRPGFWDNSGHCCGTAGVLALACDRRVECGDSQEFAEVLVADLVARATADADGVRWSNHEHRVTPSDLEPAFGWAMGNAGIVRELLRHARLDAGAAPDYAVPWPDHPPTRTPPVAPAASATGRD
jgi:lantibiotic modifying enzyme